MCADDADFIVELLNEPAFLQNIGDRGVRNTADACRYILAGPVASYEQFGFGLYLVALKETGVPIGICGLLKRESMQDIEIGFAFLERFLGQGICVQVWSRGDELCAHRIGVEAHRGNNGTGEPRLDLGAGKTRAAIRKDLSPAGTGR